MLNLDSQATSLLNHRQSGGVSKSVIASLLVISGLVILVWAMLPATFSTDLERIGQGKPAVAIIYDTENGAVNNLMEGYGAIRHEYEHLVEFLVVDATSPKGQAFIRSSQALIGSAVYYSADGEKITSVHGPQDTEFLLNSIKNAFNL